MDMSNIPLGEIVAPNIDVDPINQAIKDRAMALGSQMNPEAAAQFEADMSELQCFVKGNGSSVTFTVNPSESYLLNYLKSHDIPVSGGDNGTAHNVDGTTYSSLVDPDLWGTQLPWLELPTLDGQDEAMHLVEIMAPDSTSSGIPHCEQQIGEAAAPIVSQELSQRLGGGS